MIARVLTLGLSLTLLSCATVPNDPVATPPPTPIEQRGCETPLGFIPDGGTRTGFLQPTAPVGTSCVSGPLTCHDGVWAGEYVFPECADSTPAP